MPRKSPYEIILSSDEERELSLRAVKYTLPYFQVIRAKIILMAAQGLSNDEIAKRLNTRREVVSMWRKRFFIKRLDGLNEGIRSGRPRAFSTEIVVQVKALACELPLKYNLPLSRLSSSDVAREVLKLGIVATISDSTVWRWLHDDAIKPWQHRCWIFPRDPQFAAKAGRILDLYERCWDKENLKEDEYVLSADEKTSIQARNRIHETLPTQPGVPMKVEHEYKRCGAWVYIAALDVHRAKLFGRCEKSNGIAPFDRLVCQVMEQSPYKEARRVFWIVDNGSSHRGLKCVDRLTKKFQNIVIVHGPIHASWLNQVEIYFSVLQRKALTPNDFNSLEAVSDRLIRFQEYYEEISKPFEWKFTRHDLEKLLAKMKKHLASQNLI